MGCNMGYKTKCVLAASKFNNKMIIIFEFFINASQSIYDV